MKLIKDLTINSTDPQHPITLDIRYHDNATIKPVIIFSHGFKGFKDWGHWDRIADFFAERDYIFLKFNFSHNGTTPANPSEFGDLEAFAQNNLSKEIDDLGCVIDYILSDDFEDNGQVNSRKVLLIGHSRGGTISLLRANMDHRIKAVAAWAPIFDMDAYWTPEIRSEWEKIGRKTIANARTGQQMPLDYQMVEDYLAHKEQYSVEKSVKANAIPTLVIHGTEDEAIPYEGAKAMEHWADWVQFETIQGAKHTFGGTHPMGDAALSDHARKLVEKTESFFHNNFKN